MNETLAPPRPRRKLKWLMVAVCLLLLAGSGWLYLFRLRSANHVWNRRCIKIS